MGRAEKRQGTLFDIGAVPGYVYCYREGFDDDRYKLGRAGPGFQRARDIRRANRDNSRPLVPIGAIKHEDFVHIEDFMLRVTKPYVVRNKCGQVEKGGTEFRHLRKYLAENWARIRKLMLRDEPLLEIKVFNLISSWLGGPGHNGRPFALRPQPFCNDPYKQCAIEAVMGANYYGYTAPPPMSVAVMRFTDQNGIARANLAAAPDGSMWNFDAGHGWRHAGHQITASAERLIAAIKKKYPVGWTEAQVSAWERKIAALPENDPRAFENASCFWVEDHD